MRFDDWAAKFHRIYDDGVSRYRSGVQRPDRMFSDEEEAFLASIGCSKQELFDFVEDECQGGDPSFETVLLITAARRDYFLFVQKGKRTDPPISSDTLPAKDAEIAGFRWLPRIIVKARAKLRGQMPPELMYCCGGDRAFLHSTGIHPADFLRVVWSAGEKDDPVIQFVQGITHKSAKT